MPKTLNINAVILGDDGETKTAIRDFTRHEILDLTGIPSSTLVRWESMIRGVCPEFSKEKGGQIYTLFDLWILLITKALIIRFATKADPKSPKWQYGKIQYVRYMESHGLPLAQWHKFRNQVQNGEIEL